MSRPNIFQITAFFTVFAIYIAVRLWNLTASCLWFDEIFSVNAAEHSWNSVLNFVALDLIHPPLFYIFLKLWIGVGGESLFWLRLLPVIFSTLAVVPFFLLCRELRLGYWTSILGLFFIAVNGSLVKYSQEVRMYSALMCLSLFSIWLFVRFFRTGKGIAISTIVNLVLVYTHYFGWLVIVSEVVVIIAFQRSKWRPMVGMCCVTALGFVPWFIAVLFAAGYGSGLSQNIGWLQRPGIDSIVQLALNIVEPFYYSTTSIDPLSIYLVSVPLLLLAITAICFYLSNFKKLDTEETNTSYLLIVFVVVPVLFAFFASWILPYSVWGTRHLVIVFVPFALLVAKSLSRVSSHTFRIATFAMLMLFSGYAFVAEANRIKQPPVWCGFEVIAKTLQSDATAPVYVFEDLAAYHLWFEFRKYPDAKYRNRVVKVDNFPGMIEDRAYFIPRGLNDEYLTHGTFPLDSVPEQIWIVYREVDFDVSKPPLNTMVQHGFRMPRHQIYDGGSTKVIAVFLEKS